MLSTVAFTVLIPARLGSTRLPNKPLADIAGKPMIVQVAQRLKGCQAQAIYVATDAEEIAQTCRAHDVAVLLTRADHPSGTDRLAEAVQQLALADDAIVVNVQGDEPLMDPDLVRRCAEFLAANRQFAISTAAVQIFQHSEFTNPNIVKVVVNQTQEALYFSRATIPYPRDDAAALPSAGALRHIGLYAYRVAYLKSFSQWPPSPLEQCEKLEQLRALHYGARIGVVIADHAPAPGVDTLEDLERVRKLLAPVAGHRQASLHGG